jgi:hypothetical protein
MFFLKPLSNPSAERGRSPWVNRREVSVARVEPVEPRLLMAAFAGRVVGYLPDYEASQYSHIDYTTLTQLNYFSITPTSTGSLPTTSTDGYAFTQLSSVVASAHAAGVPVSITLDPSTPYTTIDSSTTATTALATNLAAFCSKYHLDGIDLDWEPSSATSAQLTNYASLIAALHAQTAPAGLTLSIAASASLHIVTPATAANLNWVCVMDYDLDYNSSAPYSDSISYLTSWASTGIPTAKLVMGVPFYGRAGTSWSNTMTEPYGQLMSAYAAANGGALPPTTSDSVTINGTTWGYNGAATMANKAQYVLANGYGGMCVWEMGQDDFVASQSSYNLMATIKSAMAGAAPAWQTAGGGAVFSSFALAGGAGGGITIGAGTVTLSADAGAALAGYTATVEAGGTLSIGSTQHLGALTLDGGKASDTGGAGGVLELGALSFSTSAASLDLGANDLIVHSGNLATITAEITSALGSGNIDFWDGQIGSSTAAANAGHALGVELNNDGTGKTLTTSFDGQTVVNTDVLVKYTLFGDADLNGVVNLADYLLTDSGFAVGASGWHNGDFNYDGVVNGDDYSLLDNSFNLQSELSAAVAAPAALVEQRPASDDGSAAGMAWASVVATAVPLVRPFAPPAPLPVAASPFWSDSSISEESALDELLRAARAPASAG